MLISEIRRERSQLRRNVGASRVVILGLWGFFFLSGHVGASELQTSSPDPVPNTSGLVFFPAPPARSSLIQESTSGRTTPDVSPLEEPSSPVSIEKSPSFGASHSFSMNVRHAVHDRAFLERFGPVSTFLAGSRLFPNTERRPSSVPDPAVWRYAHVFASSANPGDAEPRPLYDEIAVILNPAVERNVEYFRTAIRDRIQRALDRFYPYEPLIERIFAELGLPHDLVYLSLVESGFNPLAYSRARASGPWQFMKSTGRMYGLKVNWYVDERRDPMKSTVAAAHHLRDLYDQFGSWPLALAAYNAGAGKISRAIQKTGTRDFWRIARTRSIRRETREYVPKFMATTIIATNPDHFGFRVSSQAVHQYEEVHLNKSVHLRSLAKEAGIPFEELRRLNPELRRSIIPPDKGGYDVKVPVGMGFSVERIRSRLEPWVPPRPQFTWYRVRRGDSLSVIAHRFGISVRALKRLNNLSGNLIRVGKRLRVSKEIPGSQDVRWYRVRRGDSLWSIAKRFRVSVRKLKTLNDLRSSLIRTGRMLMISP